MKKSRIIFFGILIIVVIILAVWVGILIASNSNGTNPTGPSPYSAVYLSTGDIYFGKLSWWPSPHMTDVWYLQRTQGQNGQTQVSIQPMTSVFWGPGNEIDLNSKNIIFSTRLMNNSQVVQVMENPTAGQQNAAAANTSSTAAPMIPATSSVSGLPSGK